MPLKIRIYLIVLLLTTLGCQSTEDKIKDNLDLCTDAGDQKTEYIYYCIKQNCTAESTKAEIVTCALKCAENN